VVCHCNLVQRGITKNKRFSARKVLRKLGSWHLAFLLEKFLSLGTLCARCLDKAYFFTEPNFLLIHTITEPNFLIFSFFKKKLQMVKIEFQDTLLKQLSI